MADRRETALVAGGTALIACTYGLARYGYGLFLPTFRADFALSATLSGLLATGAFGSYCVAALLSRHLVGSGRARSATGLAGALAAGGCVAVAAAPTTAVLGVALLVAGSGAGLASPALVALVDRAVPGADRPRAQTVVNAGTGLGVLLAGPLALALTEHWRLAWLCFAALTVLATAATVRAAAPLRTADPTPPQGLAPPAPWRRLRPAILAALLAGIGSAAVWTFGRDLVVTAGGLGPLAATAFWIVLGAAGITGAIAGDAVQRWDIPRTWTSFAVTLAVATAGLALAPDVPVVAFACAAAFGGAYVALSGVLIAWGTQLHPDSPGSANATLFLTLAAGQALGALLLGSLTDATNPLIAFAAAAALAAASCLPLIARSHSTSAGKPDDMLAAQADHGTPRAVHRSPSGTSRVTGSSCMLGHVGPVTRLVTFVDVDVDVDVDAADARRISVSARHEAVLVNGRRVLLLDDRGWSVSGPPNIWAITSVKDIVDTTRMVVGPDEPFGGRSQEDMEADHWTHLAEVLRQQGVVADALELKRLSHDVLLSERLLARVGHYPGDAVQP